jgi:hypothetical protein
MPEDLPVTKCINVMVGITRSKVFFNMTQLPTSFPRNILGVHSFDIAVHELRTQETSFAGQVLNLTAAALALRTPRTPEIHSFSD